VSRWKPTLGRRFGAVDVEQRERPPHCLDLAGELSSLRPRLLAFRDGRRKYPPMNCLLAYLPDAYLRQIADYFASERPPFPPPSPVTVNAKTLAFGKALVTKGDPSARFPQASRATQRYLDDRHAPPRPTIAA
jgi:hypothetical protein